MYVHIIYAFKIIYLCFQLYQLFIYEYNCTENTNKPNNGWKPIYQCRMISPYCGSKGSSSSFCNISQPPIWIKSVIRRMIFFAALNAAHGLTAGNSAQFGISLETYLNVHIMYQHSIYLIIARSLCIIGYSSWFNLVIMMCEPKLCGQPFIFQRPSKQCTTYITDSISTSRLSFFYIYL